MATSTAQAYRNPDGSQSAKNAHGSPFNRVAQVRGSTLAERHKTLIVHMLSKNRFGDELWLSTESLQVMIGRLCYRRKSGFDTRGRRLGPCDQAARRTVQRWIDDAVSSGVIAEVFPANVWVGQGKARRFRRSATYELNPAKLAPAKTYDDWHAEKLAAKPVPRRIGPQRAPDRNPPPAQEAAASPATPITAAPVHVASPQRDAHRDTRRPPRRLTPREGPQLVAKMIELMQGYTAHVEAVGGYGYDLQPDDPRYRAPMSQEHALTAACMTLGIPHDAALEHLKLCQWKFGEAEPSP